MRKQTLTYFVPKDRKSIMTWKKRARVKLGNKPVEEFKNIKKAKKFLAITNRFLNALLQEMNQVYTYIFVQYREAWFVITTEQTRKFDEHFRTCEHFWNRTVRLRYGENSNTFVYLDFVKLADELKEMITDLMNFQRSRKNYAAINILQTLLFRIENVINALKDFDLTENSNKTTE